MSKNQVGFQVASYHYPEDYDTMRSEVQASQANGWEVLEVIHGGLRKDETGRNVDLLLVSMVKYENPSKASPKDISK